MVKYPKTPRTRKADKTGWDKLDVVVSEKLDGASVGASFTDLGLQLQSRRFVLTPGTKDQFELFHGLCRGMEAELRAVLGLRYVLFGEWLYAKHRVFYDDLPGFFVIYDLYDKATGWFLATDRRLDILEPLALPEAPILHRGRFRKVNNFSQFIGPSKFKTPNWRASVPTDGHTEDSDLMEGVYIKVEDQDRVVGRMKLPRGEFEKTRLDPSRTIIPNRLG